MSLTPPQRHVLDTLRQAARPLSAYALLDRLRAHGFSAPTQVYRALAKLAEGGRIHRLASMNAYVACRHDHCRHGATAFAICEQCGDIDEFADAGLGDSLGRWAAGRDFAVRAAVIEISGLCAACRTGTPAPGGAAC